MPCHILRFGNNPVMYNYCPKETFVGLGENYGLLIEAILKVQLKSATFYDSKASR